MSELIMTHSNGVSRVITGEAAKIVAGCLKREVSREANKEIWEKLFAQVASFGRSPMSQISPSEITLEVRD